MSCGTKRDTDPRRIGFGSTTLTLDATEESVVVDDPTLSGVDGTPGRVEAEVFGVPAALISLA